MHATTRHTALRAPSRLPRRRASRVSLHRTGSSGCRAPPYPSRLLDGSTGHFSGGGGGGSGPGELGVEVAPPEKPSAQHGEAEEVVHEKQHRKRHSKERRRVGRARHLAQVVRHRRCGGWGWSHGRRGGTTVQEPPWASVRISDFYL